MSLMGGRNPLTPPLKGEENKAQVGGSAKERVEKQEALKGSTATWNRGWLQLHALVLKNLRVARARVGATLLLLLAPAAAVALLAIVSALAGPQLTVLASRVSEQLVIQPGGYRIGHGLPRCYDPLVQDYVPNAACINLVMAPTPTARHLDVASFIDERHGSSLRSDSRGAFVDRVLALLGAAPPLPSVRTFETEGELIEWYVATVSCRSCGFVLTYFLAVLFLSLSPPHHLRHCLLVGAPCTPASLPRLW